MCIIYKYMMSSKNRLTTELFNEVFKNGSINRSDGFLIKSKDNGLGFCRAAVVVSKKNLKKAVDRNKVRRQIFNILRLNVDSLPFKDVIVVVSPKYIESEKDTKKSLLEKLVLDLSGLKD